MCINLHHRFIISIESAFRVVVPLPRKGTPLENEAFRFNNKPTIMLIFAKLSLTFFPVTTRVSSRLFFVCFWTSVILKCLPPCSSPLTLRRQTQDTAVLLLESENAQVLFFSCMFLWRFQPASLPVLKKENVKIKIFLRILQSDCHSPLWDLRKAI